ncbi:MAG: type II restriction endonuclease [Clostridia bacterium]|nr:type II restriction endonuclease [Clostridia bacterium]
MEKRNFDEWIGGFRESIANYKYYVDFDVVYENVEKFKVELNILNSLIGSKNIEKEFLDIIKQYPNTLKCVPFLLAVRRLEILAQDEDMQYIYKFAQMNYAPEQYAVLMKETGLFELLENHLVSSLIDYALGVEVGLNSNGRKNRGGHLMEDLVESHIKKAGFKEYYKEMYLNEIEEKWGLDLSSISGDGTSTKRFDFVIKTDNMVYGIETNFYASGGSKLNETARSYKMIAEEAKNIKEFKFVWITDGSGWVSARRNLKETFDVLENIYCIKDLEEGVLKKL